jgi:hypothetical protein
MYRRPTSLRSMTKGFVDPLRRALPSLPLPPAIEAAMTSTPKGGPLDLKLFGPFPIMAAPASKIRRARTISAAVRLVGWRALFVHNEVPFAVVDLGLDWQVSGTGHVRGAEVAGNFYAALEMAAQESRDRKWRNSHTLKLLKIPHVYFSALWLSGKPSLFIPTRLGTPGRPKCELWRPVDLVAEISRLGRIHARRARQIGVSR